MTDFRALCEELIEAVLSDDSHVDCVQIARCARAALAEQPVGATDEELRELRRQHDWPVVDSLLFSIARAVLAQWGQS